MIILYFHVCLIFTTCVSFEVISGEKLKNITIGYLTVDKVIPWQRDTQGRIISGAISYAVDLINNDTTVLPDYHIHLVWGDTKGDTITATKLLLDQWRQEAVAFFGLEDSCSVEARVSAAVNLPMISYKCADLEVSDKLKYPTFVRTFPPTTQVTNSLISLLLHYNWKRFTLILGLSHKPQTIAKKLLEQAKVYNITINGQQSYKDPHLPLTSGNPFPGIVEKTFIDTRVYVLLGDINAVVDLMTNLYDRGLLDTGEYIVIYVDLDTFDSTVPLKYFKRTADNPHQPRNGDAARSLLVVTLSPPSNPQYDKFRKAVNDYNEQPPFEFPNPFMKPKKITVYAAYLYDAVMLWAKAADNMTRSGGSIKDGRAIIKTMLGISYQSIQGVISSIDSNGDAEGNYTLLARVPYVSQHANFSMQPVGHFLIGSKLPKLSLFRDHNIDWVSGMVPLDEPVCGYRREKCIPPNVYTLEIVGGIIGGILLIVFIIILVAYRNWRYEQEIAGLSWQINTHDIKSTHTNGKVSPYVTMVNAGSTVSLNSNQSLDSRMSFTQVYIKTGTYKGQIVALKVYESKMLHINRDIKKQMKMMRDLRHMNINPFVGACVDTHNFIIVTEYCFKGSLQDILENELIKLDKMFIASMIKDVIQGMIFLHNSELMFHGNLKSSNCVVTSRWNVQVADFGLLEFRKATYKKEDEHAYNRNLFWTAPEILRNPKVFGSQKGDVYSFGLILYEIFSRLGVYCYCNMEPKDIVLNVKSVQRVEPFRPDAKYLNAEDYIVNCMKECWDEIPDNRPDFRTIAKKLHDLWRGMKRNIFDNMMAMMEAYQNNLENLVEERTEQLVEEKKKTETLLHRMLPSVIADQLKKAKVVQPESFECVTIYFSDICGFTKLSAESTPLEVVDMLNDLYTCFDSIIKNYDVYKVETIGDAYMVVSGVPIRNGDNHAGEVASMSLELLRAIKIFKIRHRPEETLKLRIGMHSGPCVAGVVGLTMPRYTLFGDTVNTASRLESTGEPLQIHISDPCKQILDKLGGYTITERGFVSMKGKGELFTYWLNSENEEIRHERLRRTSQTLNFSSPATREIRQAYIPHSGQNHRSIKDSLNENYSDKDNHSDHNQSTPLMDILCESERINSSVAVPKIPIEPNDSPTTSSMKARKIFQSKLFNGVIPEEKKFRLLKGSSGSDITTERYALMSDFHDDDSDSDHMSTRHHSLGTRNNIRQPPSCAMCTLPKSTKQDKETNSYVPDRQDVESRNYYNSFGQNDNLIDPETIL
ncbi:receptor-type guanylate cyclase Gyc76C-like [Mytilus galloprovincialis]|uniref:receptor-type guanylate cyclase Gyc76C-like n=1 Tax=Mytilus galloprovincialis TaxID=29158 RepID=UPI003F7C25E0